MAHRIERVNELIKNEISMLINTGLKDPRLEGKVIGVTKVKTTPDMKYCNVYISIYGNPEERSAILGVIEKAKGFIRKNLASALTTRYAPELIFEIDDSLDNAMHIEEILRKINDDDKA